jgi:hypothetical protein
MRLQSVVLLLAFALVAATGAGCVARKVAYGFADTFLYRAVDSYFDNDKEQKAFLKPRLAAHHQWHAASELPLYAEDLGVLEARAADGLDRADVDWAYERVDAARTRLVEHLLPDAVTFLSTVSPAQVEVMEEENAERNAKRAERLSGAESTYVAKRSASLEKNFRSWMGNLTAPQKARVEAFVRSDRAGHVARLDATRASQEALARALRANSPPETLRAAILAGMRPLKPAENSYQASLRDLVVDVAALATPSQREKFTAEVRAWRIDLQELSLKYGGHGGHGGR